MIKRAVILAGGLGTRLKPLTNSEPKPMIRVAGKPIIEHIIDGLSLHGIDEIIINTHYLADQINEKLESRALYYHVNKLLGHKGTIFALRKWLEDGDFWCINGDTLTDLNYTEMSNFHKSGTITAFMDSEYRSGGTWIYPKEFFSQDVTVRPFRPNYSFWDCGTPEKLETVKKIYEAEH